MFKINNIINLNILKILTINLKEYIIVIFDWFGPWCEHWVSITSGFENENLTEGWAPDQPTRLSEKTNWFYRFFTNFSSDRFFSGFKKIGFSGFCGFLPVLEKKWFYRFFNFLPVFFRRHFQSPNFCSICFNFVSISPVSYTNFFPFFFQFLFNFWCRFARIECDQFFTNFCSPCRGPVFYRF